MHRQFIHNEWMSFLSESMGNPGKLAKSIMLLRCIRNLMIPLTILLQYYAQYTPIKKKYVTLVID